MDVNVKGRDKRAQLHTLEGLAASIIILLAIVYVFNTIAVTPNSGGPSSQVEVGQRQMAEDVLAQSWSNGNLKEAIANWSEGRFNETTNAYYYEGRSPPGEFGETLEKVLWNRGMSYNIELAFNRRDGSKGTMTFVKMGEPTDNAVTVSQNVVLLDNETLHGTVPPGGNILEGGNPELGQDSQHTYPIKDSAPGAGIRLYNVVEVRMTVWRS